MAIPRPGPGGCAVVTGASSGIGAELARGLAARGHTLVLLARRGDRLRAVASELTARHGVRAEVIVADVTDHPTRAVLPERLAALELRADVLVNNAGFGVGGPFHASRLESELEQLAVLCEAPLHLMRLFLPGMVARGGGALLNVASTAGMQPLPGSAGYAAAKAHMLSLTEAVHAEVRRYGVTVTALCPGPVRTELFDREDHLLERLPGFMWLRADQVASAGLEGLDQGRRVVVPGRLIRAGSPLLRLAPRGISLRLLERALRAAT